MLKHRFYEQFLETLQYSIEYLNRKNRRIQEQNKRKNKKESSIKKNHFSHILLIFFIQHGSVIGGMTNYLVLILYDFFHTGKIA